MTIEQEFFETFGIEPKCLNEEYSGCKYANDDNRKCCKQYKDKTCNYSYFWIYPPITPEIVLGLIKIIIKQYRDFCIRDYLGAEYKAMCDNNWEDWEKEGKDCKTEEEAILSLCITIKDEIQDQVKALFNA